MSNQFWPSNLVHYYLRFSLLRRGVFLFASLFINLSFVNFLFSNFLFINFANAESSQPTYFIEQIKCHALEGPNFSEDCGKFKSFLPFEENQEVSLDDIRLAKTQLQLLPNLDQADIQLSKGSSSDKLKLTLLINKFETISSKIILGSAIKSKIYQQRIQGSVGYQNLQNPDHHWNLLLDGRKSFERDTSWESLFRVEFANTKLGPEKQYFLISALTNYNKEYQNPESKNSATENLLNSDSQMSNYAKNFFYRSYNTSFDLFIGKKINEFNSLTLGLRHYLYSQTKSSRLTDKSDLNSPKLDSEHSLQNTFIINYGFNSENDPRFATEGQRLDLGLIFTKALVSNTKWLQTPTQDYEFNFAYSYHLRSETGGVWSLELGGNPNDYIPSLDDDFSIALEYKDLFLVQNSYHPSNNTNTNTNTNTATADTERRNGLLPSNSQTNYWYVKVGSNLEKIEKTQYDYHNFLGAKLGLHYEIKNFGDLEAYIFISQLDGINL